MSFWLRNSCFIILFCWSIQVSLAQEKQWVKYAGEEIVLDQDNQKIVLAFFLEKGVHIQANEVKDPNFIPTYITLKWPENFQLDSADYSNWEEFRMIGEDKPLQVFSEEFTVSFLVEEVPSGSYEIPGELYYQACNAYKCFFPRVLNFTLKVVRK